MQRTVTVPEAIEGLDAWAHTIATHAASDRNGARVNFEAALAVETIAAISRTPMTAAQWRAFARAALHLAEVVRPLAAPPAAPSWEALAVRCHEFLARPAGHP